MSARASRGVQTLRGNQPVLVDGSAAWVIRSGTVALFAVLSSDAGDRPRRFLFTLGTGEAILWSAVQNAGLTLLAVAIEEAQLDEISPDILLQSALNGDEEAATMIRKWANRLVCVPDAETEGPGRLLAAAIAAQQEFIESIQRTEQLREEADRRRFANREAFNVQLARQAMADLASVSRGRSEERLSRDGSPLLAALRRVGQAQGLTVRLPESGSASAHTLTAILDASQVRSRSVLLTGRWWREDAGPLLGYLSAPASADGSASPPQPVALIPWRKSIFAPTRYRMYAGAEGTSVSEDVAANLEPWATALYAPLPESAGTWRLLRFAFRGRGGDCTVALIAGLMSTVLGMLMPQASLILFEYAVPSADKLMIVHLGLGLAAAATGALLFDLARSFSMLRVETHAVVSLQTGLWDRLLQQSPAFFRRFTTGDLSSRAATASQLRQLLNENVLSTVFMGLVSLLNVALLFYYSTTLALGAVAVAIIAAAVSASAGVLMQKIVKPLQQMDGDLFGLMVQLVNAVPKLRIAGAEGRAFAEWSRAYSRKQRLRQQVQALGDRIRLTGLVTPPAAMALLFWLAYSSLQAGNPAGNLTLGSFIAFNAAFGMFLAGATSLGDSTPTLLYAVSLWKRMSPILEAVPEIDLRHANPGPLRGGIVMDHLTFRYREDGPLTLDGVNLHAEPGECIAIVGPSGSGKSTLVNMLLKFETPSQGAIYYDGHDLNSLDIHAVRRQLGVVTQENKIMAGTVYENIVSSSLCKMDEAWEAARSAGLAEDIELMPMGMHTMISEAGGNISGGQRQRLLIARALIQKPRILILDEATSALDNRTQAIVTRSLENLKVTRVIVAHRLSTIRSAHRIYVMERGRVVQEGKFDTLLQEDGLFRRLMQRQMA